MLYKKVMTNKGSDLEISGKIAFKAKDSRCEKH